MQRNHSRCNPAYTESLLSRLSPANQPIARTYATAKLAQGRKVSSVQRALGVLWRVDRETNGTPFAQIEPHTLTSILESYARQSSPYSATAYAATLKAFYSWCNDDECPRQIRRALKRNAKLDWDAIVPITDDEFRALLTAAEDTVRDDGTRVRRLALLWLLWDSGFRISEAMAVRVGDVHFDDEGGALVGMDPQAPDLKTGPRSIYLVECVGALRLWIALHPRRDVPDAPLFINKQADDRMIPTNVNVMLMRLCKKANLRPIHPHMFRHTRATRVADAGWNEAQMRPFFGWGPSSTIPSRYIHLSKRQLKERVQRDAQLDPLAARIREDPKAALAEAVTAAASAAASKIASELLARLGIPDVGAPPVRRPRIDDGRDATRF